MLGPISGEPAHRFRRDEGADTIVETPGDDAAVRVLFDTAIQHPRIADANSRRRLVTVCRADVDPQVDYLCHTVQVFFLQLVDVAGQNEHALPYQDLRVPSSDAAEVEEAVLINVSDLDPDFIDVPRQHHAGLPLGIQYRHGIAVHIDADAVGEGAGLVTPHAARGLLKPGRSRRVEQLLQKSDGLDGHAIV